MSTYDRCYNCGTGHKAQVCLKGIELVRNADFTINETDILFRRPESRDMFTLMIGTEDGLDIGPMTSKTMNNEDLVKHYLPEETKSTGQRRKSNKPKNDPL